MTIEDDPELIPAATVLLLRDGPDSGALEVLMLRRNSKIAFGGAWVFPGGRVDDHEHVVGDPVASARRAAVREVDEETGLDIAANRLPDVFIDRAPGPDSPVLRRLEDLASGTDERSVSVIFPEGTFHTPERLDRAATRLGATRPDLEPLARTLRYMLPPRPSGTLALLRGAPDADIVLMGHVGLEGFGSMKEILERIPRWPITLASLAIYVVIATIATFAYYRFIARFDPRTAFFCAVPGGSVQTRVTARG